MADKHNEDPASKDKQKKDEHQQIKTSGVASEDNSQMTQG